MDDIQIYEFIIEYFDYSEKHKGLVYKKATAYRNVNKIGQKAGNKHPLGYYGIKIKGKVYKEHRLVFLMFHRHFPEGELDHINKDGYDNRIENIRQCSRSENCANRRAWGKNYRGVHLHKRTGKYEAGIRIKGKRKYLGLYSDPKDAARAYDKEAILAFGEFAELNFEEDYRNDKPTT